MTGPHLVDYPRTGTWRLGRAPDPYGWRHPDPVDTRNSGAGNRFDSFHGNFGVIYCATTPQACYAETLARFRPQHNLADIVREEWEQQGRMDVGSISADWRNSRILVRLGLAGPLPFVDIAHSETLDAFRDEPRLVSWLESFGIASADLGNVVGSDRRVTRVMSQWLAESTDEDGHHLFGGIRYTSRLGSDFECWAIFQGSDIVEIERRSVKHDDPDMGAVAQRYNLVMH